MARDLMLELRRRGVRLRLTDGRLDVLAPAGTLTPELRAELRERRDQLVAFLRRSAGGAGPAELVPCPEDEHEPFPLTDIQHAYWVGRGSSVELGGVATHFYVELERAGLDVDRLAAALDRVVARHGMLRAVVDPDGRQRVLPEVPPYRIACADLRGLPAAEQAARLAAVREEMGHQVLPTDRWPLFEVRASRLDGDLVRLHVDVDLLIADGFSFGLVFADWRRAYEDPDWSPAPPAVAFRDHVLAEEARRGGSEYAAAEAYWLDRLDDLPPAPALPLATQPARLGRPRFDRRRGHLPRSQWDEVKRQARQRGITPSVALLTTFADVLARWSGQPALTLSLSLFNRPPVHPQIGEVVGDFTSVTLLAVEPDPDAAFADRAGAVQRQLLRDLEHLSYSGVRLLRERARRLGGGPSAAMPVVFTSTLALDQDEDPVDGRGFFGGTGFFGTFREGISQTPQVWLDHQVAEEQGELFYNWDLVPALFPPGLVDDLFAAYGARLAALAGGGPVWDVPSGPVPLPAGQLAVRARVAGPAVERPDVTLWDLVDEQVRIRPDAVAVAGDGWSVRYGELGERARRLARCLGGLGTRAGELVAVVAERGADDVAAVLGIAGSGAAYLPIDPDWPAARRDQLLAQGRVRTVVTTPTLRDGLDWPAGLRLLTVDDPLVRAADPGPVPGPAPADLAYVIFTSGSTGRPKGVMIDHRGAVNTVLDVNRRWGVGPGDAVLALSALSFDLSVWDVFGMLAAGGTVVRPAPGRGQDPAHWTDLVRRYGVTVWNSVPALMQAWLDPGADGPATGPASTLRLVLLSGDWIPVPQPDHIRGRHPAARVVSLGGATEASIWSVFHEVGDVGPGWSSIPYGRPLANQTVAVLDDRLDDCPDWTVGEIWIGGTGVALGYWADPDRTAERFVVHPRTGRRLYRTGDLGRYRPDGELELLGRADNQVKINGYRIEPGEVAAVLRDRPGIRDALVTVGTNPATGSRQLLAYVVPERVDPAGAPVGTGVWTGLLDAARTERAGLAAGLAPGLAAYGALLERMNALCPPLLTRTLARLGALAGDGPLTAERVLANGGGRSRYRGLVEQWLVLLAARGVLRATGPGEYELAGPLDLSAVEAELAERLAGLDGAAADGPLRVLAHYLRDCAGSQPELLRGQVNVLEFLLPDGSWAVPDAMYADNPLARLENTVLARAVRAVVADRPAGRIRVLELGAGVGATTAALLPELPAGRTSYRFTDVSTFFIDHGRQRFGDRLDYGVHDIDAEPGPQGVPPASVDLVVAANVLHNAADLDLALRRLRSVLAPGGLLLAVENTRNEPFHLVTVGFYQDFGGYRDGRVLPLLAPGEWRERLGAAGFAAAAALPDDGADPLGQHVLAALAGTSIVDPATLRAALERVLPAYLVPQHYLVLDAAPLGPNGKVDLAALPVPWRTAGPAEQVPPRTALERTLVDIWAEALSRPGLGVTDNFFELGGDSLHAVRVLARLRDELGIRLDADEGLRTLFDNPTVLELAEALGQPAGG